MARLDDPRIAAITAPLPEGAPDAGEFRYSTDFEALEGAIRRGDKEGPNAIDWPDVGRRATAILTSQSKDLVVCAWLTVALARTEGLAGLATALAVLHDIADTYWDTMFPPKARERARVQALDWLALHAARAVPEKATPEQEPAALAAAAEATAIEGLFGQKLTKEQSSLGDLVRALRPLADAARRAEADRAAAADAEASRAAAPPAPASPASAPSASSGAAPVAISIATDAGADKTISAIRTALREPALALLQADLREPRAYALLRAITWIEITEAPPSTGGRTPLSGPPATHLTSFEAMRAARNNTDLVLELEAFLSGSGQFWLDGQRMAHQALLDLGPAHAPAAREIARGVALALERLPFLVGLTFQDGMPFADAATQAWIEREATLGAGQAASGDPAPWTAGIEAARNLVADGKLEDAVAALAQGAAGGGSGRARFRWQLALARVCLDAGHAPIALPVLRQALADAERVQSWEPEATADAALLLYRCLTLPTGGLELDAADQSREVSAALAVLARIDPVSAMRALRV